MKHRTRVGCLGLLVGVVLSYTTWVVLPTSHYDSDCQQVVARATEARKRLQSQALDASKNGYLDPDFLPFWEYHKANSADAAQILAGKDTPPQCEIRTLIETVLPLSDPAQGKKTELEELVMAKSAKALQPFLDFEAFYPKVHKVENMPVFIVPSSESWTHTTSKVANFIALRKLAHCCAGYTDYLVLTTQGDKALAVCQDSLRFGRTLAGVRGTLIESMFAAALQSIAHSSLAMVLQSEAKFSLGSLKALAKTLEDTNFPETLLSDSLEAELCVGLNTLDESAEQPGQGVFGWLPGLLSREIRLFKNDFFPILKQARVGSVMMNQAPSGNLSDWFTGRHGLMSALMIPNCSGAEQQFRLARKRQAFLHLYTYARIYRLAKGKWPAKLDDLSSVGYKPLAGFDVARVHYLNMDRKVEIQLELETSEHSYLSTPTEDMKKWQVLSSPSWVLH
jgi:hypothetical protein